MPFYRFSSASVAADDGYNVIAPNVGTGRWLLLRSDIGVPTIAALQSVPVTERSPNVSLYVASENAWYSFKSAAATLPTDIAPTTGAGSWELNTAIVEVVPPYQKVFSSRDAVATVDRIEFFVVQAINYPVREAIARADRAEYVYLAIVPYPVKEALARADKLEFFLLGAIDYPVKEAVARAENIGFSIVVGNAAWLDLTTAEWLDTAPVDWLDQAI